MPHGRSKVWYALGAFVFLGIGVGIGVLANRGGGPAAAGTTVSKAATTQAGLTPTTTSQANAQKPTPTPVVAPVLIVKPKQSSDQSTIIATATMTPEQAKKTGFDIRVEPAGARVRLNNKDIGAAPLRVRNLKTGAHLIEIIAPKGYVTLKKTIELQAGQAQELNIVLEKTGVKLPATVVVSFTSEPPGATVTLYTDDRKLISKTTPIKMKLRTGHTYQAEFARAGYTTIKKPVDMADGNDVRVAVVMQAKRVAVTVSKTTRVVTRRRRLRRPSRRARAAHKRRVRVRRSARRSKAATRAGYGTLLIGSKPPCRIYIGGRYRGMTPQRSIRLRAGKHRVSLINRKYRIRRTITVRIRSRRRTRVIRDYSHKIR